MAESAQCPPPKKAKRKGKANSFDVKWIEHFKGIVKSLIGSKRILYLNAVNCKFLLCVKAENRP